jgi:hypothetical protein
VCRPDPNCFSSNDDFVIVQEHPKFKLLRVEREGFAKVFFWQSVLSNFEWKLKCEYASSKTGAWQQPVYSVQHIHSPEAQVGLVLALDEDKVVVGNVYKGTAADRCGAVTIGDALLAIDGVSILDAVAKAEEAAQRPPTTWAEARCRTASGDSPTSPHGRRTRPDDGRNPVAKAALLRARTNLLGAQGTFTWLTLQRESDSPPAIHADYLPTFAPHIVFEDTRDNTTDARPSWVYQVRLLRGDRMYISGILALDWRLDKEQQELSALELAHRKMLLHKLLDASAEGNEEEVQELLKARADPNGSNDAAVTALHLAAFHGHNTIAALLLASRADVNAGDCFQAAPLHKAARNGHAEVAQTLLDFGADVNHVDLWESSAMHWATVGDNMKMVELLSVSGADIGQRTVDGHTASALKKADMFKGYRYTQSLLVPDDLPRTEEAPPASGDSTEDEEKDDEAAADEDAQNKEREREWERESERERERARERAEERRRRMEQERELQAQMQRNLMAAAGMQM